jgi:hypothetical protein
MGFEMSMPHWRTQTAEDARDMAVNLLVEWLTRHAAGGDIPDSLYEDTANFLDFEPTDEPEEEDEPDGEDEPPPRAA